MSIIMHPSIITFITKAAAIASDKIAKTDTNSEDNNDALVRSTAINNELKSISSNSPLSRARRYVLNYMLNAPHYNKDLHKKIRTDFQNGTGAANPVGTDDAFYKQEVKNNEGVRMERPVSVVVQNADEDHGSSFYNPWWNQIQIHPMNHNDIAALGHEIGHAQDPLLPSYLKYNPDREEDIANEINSELRASENGRRMLRDGYGVSDDIAKGAYIGVPTYIARRLYPYSPDDSYDPVQAKFGKIYPFQYLPLRIKPRTPIGAAYKRNFTSKDFNPSVKKWSPESINAIRDFEHKMGWTPENIARQFTEAITSPDPIKRRVETTRLNNKAKYVDINDFESDESAYNSFMPKLPEARPSGISINGKPIHNNWQPVRTNSIYSR